MDPVDEAVDAIVERVPADASVMDDHSTTLEEIGFIAYLSDTDPDWDNLHGKVWSIEDDAERAQASREAQGANHFLGKVNAIAETSELVVAGASGSRIGAYPFAAENLLLVAGATKVVDDIDAAFDRLEEVTYPSKTLASRRRR